MEGSAWSVLPTADAIGPAPTLVDGDRLIAPALGCSDGGEENGYGRCIPYGSILDTRTSTWSALPGGPSGSAGGMDGFGGRSPDGLVGGSASGGPFYDAAEDAWVDLPPLDPEDGREAERVVTRLAVPAGDALVVVGGSAWGPDGGAPGVAVLDRLS